MTEIRGAMHTTRPDGVARRLMGHLWTVGPSLAMEVYGAEQPPSQNWQTSVTNDRGEPIVRSGLLSEVEGAQKLVVILHGMGGSVDRGYCVLAAGRARQMGMSSLRIALRGADGVGMDLHHAGFVDDLGPMLSHPDLQHYRSIALVGYSLGGHVALTAALGDVEPRVKAVAALCPPLDLNAAQEAIDSRRATVYRRYILRSLKRTYRRIARGAPIPTPADRIDRVRRLREWDALTVVPRFGFGDVDDYYRTQSVGPKLNNLEVPALVVASPGDPLVPAKSLRGPLSRAAPSVVVRWVHDGGHVFFPPGVELGLGSRPGVEAQVMEWVDERLAA